MLRTEYFKAYGHHLIKATHSTTLEITKENFLTKRGDCIIGIKSEKACIDLSKDLKELIKQKNSMIKLILECEGYVEQVEAYGSPLLLLTNPISIVIRKSNYIDNRTLAINSNKAAKDLNRDFVKIISNDNAIIDITIEVYGGKI